MNSLPISAAGDSHRRRASTRAAHAVAQPVITMSDVDRPAGLAMLLWSGGRGRAYMCDTAAHVVDVIDAFAQPLFSFGGFGDGPGRFNEPCDILVVPSDPWMKALTTEPALVIVADRGNHRLQLFEPDGVLMAILSSNASVCGRAGRSSNSPVDVNVSGLVHPSRLAWRGPWLEITTYGHRLIRIDLARALRSGANDIDRRAARLTPRRALTQHPTAEPTRAHASLPLAVAEGRW